MPRDSWTHDRRRGHRRIVPYSLEALIQGTAEPVSVQELGPGGLVVESRHALKAGNVVGISLGTGPQRIGPLQGRVVHCRLILPLPVAEPPVYLAGIAFEHVTPIDAARIGAWLGDIDNLGGPRTLQNP